MKLPSDICVVLYPVILPGLFCELYSCFGCMVGLRRPTRADRNKVNVPDN